MSVLAVSALGDALGASYEFGEYSLYGTNYPELNNFVSGKAGEWTDDTAQALCITEAFLEDKYNPLDLTARKFVEWYQEDGRGVGIQTRIILQNEDSSKIDFSTLGVKSSIHHKSNPSNSAGNGSLMRIHPISLLNTDNYDLVADYSRKLTLLTHADEKCISASVLWVELLRTARIENEFNPFAGMKLLPPSSINYWEDIINEALTTDSSFFGKQPWWVVPAFQQALSAVNSNMSVIYSNPMEVFRQIIACDESDSDTVCAIAGGLMGALGTTIDMFPENIVSKVYGLWPEYLTLPNLVRKESELLDIKFV